MQALLLLLLAAIADSVWRYAALDLGILFGIRQFVLLAVDRAGASDAVGAELGAYKLIDTAWFRVGRHFGAIQFLPSIIVLERWRLRSVTPCMTARWRRIQPLCL
jgi:hypothetical protein